MVQVVAALIWNNGKFLACQRPLNKSRALLWEFVGGKVEPGETHQQALQRECMEELAVDVAVGSLFMQVVHTYPDVTVQLFLYNARIVHGTPCKLEHNDICWLAPQEVDDFEFCPADKDILEKIKQLS